MTSPKIRQTYGMWHIYNDGLRDAIAGLTDEQLSMSVSAEHWPLWAMVGHLACQRVFGLCDLAGEPGADTTPFTNAAYYCPGDEDLEHPLSAAQLVEALDSTFRIIERCLDTWTVDMLDEVMRPEGFDEEWFHTRGWIIQRAFIHDIFHCGEIWQALGIHGLPKGDLWNWGA